LQTAKVAKSNADAAARLAVQNAARATAAAKTAKQAATAAFAAEQAQQITLQNTLASSQRELDAAQSELATLNNQRAQYLAYKVEQARLARIRAEKARQARLRAEQAARDRARARARHRQHSGNGGGVPISDPGPSAPGGGGWTAAKGRQAANRALTWLGEPYIWSGGNAYGPTNGGCTDPVAPCGTVGFDCSGLVLYAWGRNNWAHFAASQYFVGSYHPSAGNFQKGDLLFWTGGESQISHVAIYVGGGNVVQAPQSGDIVKVTPWDQVESGYAGATRPLT
jgi:cell wall-associated NlpC family hydrolase